MARNYTREFLELCCFSEEEIEKYGPRWEFAAKQLRLDDKRMEFALDHYIPENWDIKYMGVRKMIGAYTREVMDAVETPQMAENGVKIVYGILPCLSTYYNAIKVAGGDKVFIGAPDMFLSAFLNGFFNAAGPLYAEAEARGFSYGCRHCPLNKMRLAAYATGIIAAPDIIWSWGYNCDEGPKTDEFIQHITGKKWNYHISRLPHDSEFAENEWLMEDRLRYTSETLKLGMKKVEEATGITVTDEHIAQANADQGRMIFKVAMATGVITNANPPVLGGETITMFAQTFSLPFNSGYTYIEDAIDTLTKELKAAAKAGEGVMPKDTPVVGFWNVPVTVPWINRIFRDNGVLVILNSCMAATSLQMSPSNYPDDPWMAAAETWVRNSSNMHIKGEARELMEKLDKANLDGIIMGLFDFDRWMGAQHKMLAKIITEELGMPSYYLEGDYWDDREYNQEALRTKIESISQIITTRKAIKLAQQKAQAAE